MFGDCHLHSFLSGPIITDILEKLTRIISSLGVMVDRIYWPAWNGDALGRFAEISSWNPDMSGYTPGTSQKNGRILNHKDSGPLGAIFQKLLSHHRLARFLRFHRFLRIIRIILEDQEPKPFLLDIGQVDRLVSFNRDQHCFIVTGYHSLPSLGVVGVHGRHIVSQFRMVFQQGLEGVTKFFERHFRWFLSTYPIITNIL